MPKPCPLCLALALQKYLRVIKSICEMGTYEVYVICIGPAKLSWVVRNVENPGSGRPVYKGA
jgi:hypothetical protein